ncbi:MAG: hypothetical protein AAF654_02045 [Myxococcota bacterium]
MKKFIVCSIALSLVACGGDFTPSPNIDALSVQTPLYSGVSAEPGCAMEEVAAGLLASQFSLVRERAGAPAALLDALDRATWQALGADRQQRSAEFEGRLLTAFERIEGGQYVTDIYYREASVADQFRWAEGTMNLDRSAGSWKLFGWNEQPLMNIDWFQNGGDLEVSHDLVGTSVAAVRTRTTRDETVIMQDGSRSAAVGLWDLESDRGWVEVEGIRTCLVANAGRSLCQRVCENGR